VGERDGMAQVHSFALGLGAIHVDEDDFSGQATEHECIRKSGAHIAKSDDGDTSSTVGTVHLDSPQTEFNCDTDDEENAHSFGLH
jgi:hypothetical protein